VTDNPGPLALVGSGEYLPQMRDIEAALLADRPARYVQLATAAAPEGQTVLDRWHRLGLEQATALGVEQVVLPVQTREDAVDQSIADRVAGAGLIYLSGGNPDYLARTLRGTAVWQAIVRAWKAGAALAGCSAGAMALCGYVPSLRHPRSGTEGLGLLPHLRVLPHFDRYGAHLPDPVSRFLAPHDSAVTLVGIDEDTALVGGPGMWRVAGRQRVHVLGASSRVLSAGEDLDLTAAWLTASSSSDDSLASD
jgi:cyanophycinase